MNAVSTDAHSAKTATFLRKLEGMRGDARLYRLSAPMRTDEGDDVEYVVVSGVYAMFTGEETYIFPANERGKITDWGELGGSFRGSINHAEALERAGYTVKEEQNGQ